MSMSSSSDCFFPINDLKADDGRSEEERIARCKLATTYRLVNEFGWTQIIYNHISLRLSEQPDRFLVNPFGLLYEEVTAGRLLTVNTRGEVVDVGSTSLGFNAAGMTLHAAIHEVRPDLACVIHVHTPQVVAVSAMKCGLLPVSQEALIIGEVSYHPYSGILIDPAERLDIQRNMGPVNKVMVLRNHGLVACGGSVEEAFHYLYHAVLACSAQVMAMSGGRAEDVIVLDRTKLDARTQQVANSDMTTVGGDGVKLTASRLQFEALVRKLDRRGFRTGYPYVKADLLASSGDK